MVGPDSMLRLSIFDKIVILCNLFGVLLYIHVSYGGIWFLVIICKWVMELWLVMWRFQYIYSYHMEKKRKEKSPTVSFLMVLFSYFGLIWVCDVTDGSLSKEPTKSSTMDSYPNGKTSSLPDSKRTDNKYSLVISLLLDILSPRFWNLDRTGQSDRENREPNWNPVF